MNLLRVLIRFVANIGDSSELVLRLLDPEGGANDSIKGVLEASISRVRQFSSENGHAALVPLVVNCSLLRLIGDDQYDTGRFGRQDVSVASEFLQFPPILCISLKRFETSARTGKREKIVDYMSFPAEMDLTKYITDNSDSYVYEIYSVLVHKGSAAYGHYVAFIRTLTNDRWYKFDDSSVTSTTLDEATVQNFGGSSARNAVMLVYVKRSEIRRIFQPVALPDSIQEHVAEVKVRSVPSLKKGTRYSNTRKVDLFTDSDFRRAVLEGITAAELTEIAYSIDVDENDTNHDLYQKAAVCLATSPSLIRVWKVGPHRLPVSAITDNVQRCSTKESILYVQLLPEPLLAFKKSMRVAFLSFFFPSATPKVQFIGSVTISRAQPITQVFQFVYSVLQVPGIMLRVYCDGLIPIEPIPQDRTLMDLHLIESAHYILESAVILQTSVRVGYFAPKPEEFVNYYSMLRPEGDANVKQYLERRTAQLFVNLYHVNDPYGTPVTVTAPENLPVTEMPRFIIFATHARFNPKRDTLQIFRRKANSEVNEVMPYPLRDSVTLKSLFVSQLKRGVRATELKLFYDIIEGYTPEDLKSVVIRTCEVYDTPAHHATTVRVPMRETEPISALGDYIREHVRDYGEARYLVDDDGIVRFVKPNERLDANQVIRFDVIPEDQLHMGPGEFLVVMKVGRASKQRERIVDYKQSFFFKIIPQELADATCQRIINTKFADARLAPYLLFVTPSGRILNGDECLSDLLSTYDIAQVLLPDRARENSLLRDTHDDPNC